LYAAKSAKGLTVIGVPCNDFGAQERGDDATIQNFCASRYNVSFPMTRKVEIVASARRHPFYQWVARQIGEEALPKWNFHKYLVDRSGALVGTFAPAVTPLGQELLAAVQKAVAVADPAPAVSQAS
jgi:glutathione peroxidase